MTGGLIGADPEQLMTLNNRLTTQANAVTELKADISGAIQGTTWQGPARQEFEANWNGNYSPALDRLALGLNELAKAVAAKARDLLDAMG